MTKEQKIIKAKIGFLELAKSLGNVSRAAADGSVVETTWLSSGNHLSPAEFQSDVDARRIYDAYLCSRHRGRRGSLCLCPFGVFTGC